MTIQKCPRCELNYIRDGEEYCKVCMREIKKEKANFTIEDMCIECGEHPALPGNDICSVCFLESKLLLKKAKESVSDAETSSGNSVDAISIDLIDDNGNLLDDMDEMEIDEDFSMDDDDEEGDEDETDNENKELVL